MSQDVTDNTQWGIVELMGRKVVAGRISKSEEFGTVLLRVDVPATSAFPEYTQMYGNSAIYCVTFTSEEVARRTAEAAKVNPVSVYVPDLITREDLERVNKQYQEHLERLQNQLPAGATQKHEDPDYGDGDSRDEWEDDDED